MKTVADLLGGKRTAVWSTTPDTIVFDALTMMAEKNVGALPVLDGDRLVGIFSERDYARKIILKGRTSRETAVREIMTANVVSIRPDETVERCMSVMTEKHFRHLPVVESGRLVGIISIGDVVKSVIEEQEATISHLQGYITGQR